MTSKNTSAQTTEIATTDANDQPVAPSPMIASLPLQPVNPICNAQYREGVKSSINKLREYANSLTVPDNASLTEKRACETQRQTINGAADHLLRLFCEALEAQFNG